MNSHLTFQTDWASPPGDTIKDLLEERSLSVKEFSQRIGHSFVNTKGLLNGNLEIDDQLAERLVEVLGSTTSFWRSREELYREDLYRLNKASQEQKDWIASLPTKDMVKHGWIEPTRSWKEKAKQCLNFFGMDSVNHWYEEYEKNLLITAFRTSESFDSKPESVVTWLRQGEILSLNQKSESWNEKKFRDSLSQARALTRVKSPENFIPELQKLFAASGVTLAIVPSPSGCRASGATFFTKKGKAVIMLSFRYLSEDHFWFTLFHEVGHILLHGKGSIFLEGINNNGKHEDEANRFAESFLIPEEWQPEFERLSYSKWRDIPRFAKKIGISPGIVVGQLQHKKVIGHHQLNKLKTRYRWANEGSSPDGGLTSK